MTLDVWRRILKMHFLVQLQISRQRETFIADVANRRLMCGLQMIFEFILRRELHLAQLTLLDGLVHLTDVRAECLTGGKLLEAIFTSVNLFGGAVIGHHVILEDVPAAEAFLADLAGEMFF